MTREEAIKVLNMVEAHGIADEAKRVAIEALHREEAEEKGYCHRIIPSNVEVVVRCKDCIHWREDTDHTCRHHGGATPMCANDYCSMAERRE